MSSPAAGVLLCACSALAKRSLSKQLQSKTSATLNPSGHLPRARHATSSVSVLSPQAFRSKLPEASMMQKTYRTLVQGAMAQDEVRLFSLSKLCRSDGAHVLLLCVGASPAA
jgi:hypothetical protein